MLQIVSGSLRERESTIAGIRTRYAEVTQKCQALVHDTDSMLGFSASVDGLVQSYFKDAPGDGAAASATAGAEPEKTLPSSLYKRDLRGSINTPNKVRISEEISYSNHTTNNCTSQDNAERQQGGPSQEFLYECTQVPPEFPGRESLDVVNSEEALRPADSEEMLLNPMQSPSVETPEKAHSPTKEDLERMEVDCTPSRVKSRLTKRRKVQSIIEFSSPKNIVKSPESVNEVDINNAGDMEANAPSNMSMSAMSSPIIATSNHTAPTDVDTIDLAFQADSQ